jgi:hypothetical protein
MAEMQAMQRMIAVHFTATEMLRIIVFGAAEASSPECR